MKKNYNKPGMNIKQFNREAVLTVSSALSAEEKALNELNDMGTTQNISVEWLFEDIAVQ